MDLAAQERLLRPAEHLLRGVVEEREAPLGIHRPDPLAQVLGDGADETEAVVGGRAQRGRRAPADSRRKWRIFWDAHTGHAPSAVLWKRTVRSAQRLEERNEERRM